MDFSHLPWFSASTGDLTMLAMLLCPVTSAKRNRAIACGRAGQIHSDWCCRVYPFLGSSMFVEAIIPASPESE
ncbi:hypothetical protein F5146DRAFT_495216 [Armillaria mellea]|nr:hypothetical protein F5146DRAFT_495216 [Armillaria mellea]